MIRAILVYCLFLNWFNVNLGTRAPIITDNIKFDELEDLSATVPPVAGAKLQQISRNLLSYTPNGLTQELISVRPDELKRSLKTAFNWNLLHEAVNTDNTEAVEVLITKFAFDPNAWNPHFGTCAYLVKSVRMVKMLQNCGCDFSIERPCLLYDSPLDSALKRKNLAFFASQPDRANLERIANFVDVLRASQETNSSEPIKASRKGVFEKVLIKMAACDFTKITNANLKIRYEGQEGVDAGGITFDFMSFAIQELINEGKTFEFIADRGIYDLKLDDDLRQGFDCNRIRLAGYLVGLSLFHHNPLGIVFAPIIYELIIAKDSLDEINFVALAMETSAATESSFHNIRVMDETTLNSLEYVSEPISKRRRLHNFVLDRRSIPDYLQSTAKYTIYDRKKDLYDQFMIGLNRAIDSSIIRDFLTTENLKQMILGEEKDYTGADLMENLHHFLGFGEEGDRIQQWLTEIIDEMTQNQRAEFLNFSMAMKRLPIGGFAELAWKFRIELLPTNAPQSPDDFLPVVATCSNTLFLPLYTDKEVMRAKLLKAIEMSPNFGRE